MSPQTASGRALDTGLAYDASPEFYLPGDYFQRYRAQIVAIEREAQALVLDALEAAVRAHLEPKHWALGNDDPEDYRRRCVDIHCGAFVDRGQHKEGCGVAAVLDAIQQQRSKP